MIISNGTMMLHEDLIQASNLLELLKAIGISQEEFEASNIFFDRIVNINNAVNKKMDIKNG